MLKKIGQHFFNINKKSQHFLETLIIEIVNNPNIIQARSVIRQKSRSDYLVSFDMKSDKRYKDKILEFDPNAIVFSEEGKIKESIYVKKSGGWIIIDYDLWGIDPIDGSTAAVASGAPNRSYLTTAAMEIIQGEITAIAVGDVYNKYVYGTDGTVVYRREKELNYKKRKVLQISSEKRDLSSDKIFISVHNATPERNKLIQPLFKHFHFIAPPRNPLALFEGGPRSYGCALEPVPVGLHEHIGQLLCELAGCTLTRLDGFSLLLDPSIKQTSVVAVNQETVKKVIELFSINVTKHVEYASPRNPFIHSIVTPDQPKKQSVVVSLEVPKHLWEEINNLVKVGDSHSSEECIRAAIRHYTEERPETIKESNRKMKEIIKEHESLAELEIIIKKYSKP